MKVKKLGIGGALGKAVFPGGETEMLERIEILSFELQRADSSEGSSES